MMGIKKYGCYEFEIFSVRAGSSGEETAYTYEIYVSGCPPYDDRIIESIDYYETEQEARFAVIGHITQLEKGS